jgi:hypothetical protein
MLVTTAIFTLAQIIPIGFSRSTRQPAVISGAVIGIQPLIELGLMPVAVIGALFAVAANICLALTSSADEMFAGKLFRRIRLSRRTCRWVFSAPPDQRLQ